MKSKRRNSGPRYPSTCAQLWRDEFTATATTTTTTATTTTTTTTLAQKDSQSKISYGSIVSLGVPILFYVFSYDVYMCSKRCSGSKTNMFVLLPQHLFS